VLAACAGSSTKSGGSGKSAEQLEQEILEEAERLNSCATLSDCEAISYNCGSLYVNASSDTAELEDLIRQHDAKVGQQGCPALCACGVLFCQSGKCVKQSGDCMTVPDGGMQICQ
jgi:hypothetical protein